MPPCTRKAICLLHELSGQSCVRTLVLGTSPQRQVVVIVRVPCPLYDGSLSCPTCTRCRLQHWDTSHAGIMPSAGTSQPAQASPSFDSPAAQRSGALQHAAAYAPSPPVAHGQNSLHIPTAGPTGMEPYPDTQQTQPEQWLASSAWQPELTLRDLHGDAAPPAAAANLAHSHVYKQRHSMPGPSGQPYHPTMRQRPQHETCMSAQASQSSGGTQAGDHQPAHHSPGAQHLHQPASAPGSTGGVPHQAAASEAADGPMPQHAPAWNASVNPPGAHLAIMTQPGQPDSCPPAPQRSPAHRTSWSLEGTPGGGAYAALPPDQALQPQYGYCHHSRVTAGYQASEQLQHHPAARCTWQDDIVQQQQQQQAAWHEQATWRPIANPAREQQQLHDGTLTSVPQHRFQTPAAAPSEPPSYQQAAQHAHASDIFALFPGRRQPLSSLQHNSPSLPACQPEQSGVHSVAPSLRSTLSLHSTTSGHEPDLPNQRNLSSAKFQGVPTAPVEQGRHLPVPVQQSSLGQQASSFSQQSGSGWHTPLSRCCSCDSAMADGQAAAVLAQRASQSLLHAPEQPGMTQQDSPWQPSPLHPLLQSHTVQSLASSRRQSEVSHAQEQPPAQTEQDMHAASPPHSASASRRQTSRGAEASIPQLASYEARPQRPSLSRQVISQHAEAMPMSSSFACAAQGQMQSHGSLRPWQHGPDRASFHLDENDNASNALQQQGSSRREDGLASYSPPDAPYLHIIQQDEAAARPRRSSSTQPLVSIVPVTTLDAAQSSDSISAAASCLPEQRQDDHADGTAPMLNVDIQTSDAHAAPTADEAWHHEHQPRVSEVAMANESPAAEQLLGGHVDHDVISAAPHMDTQLAELSASDVPCPRLGQTGISRQLSHLQMLGRAPSQPSHVHPDWYGPDPAPQQQPQEQRLSHRLSHLQMLGMQQPAAPSSAVDPEVYGPGPAQQARAEAQAASRRDSSERHVQHTDLANAERPGAVEQPGQAAVSLSRVPAESHAQLQQDMAKLQADHVSALTKLHALQAAQLR